MKTDKSMFIANFSNYKFNFTSCSSHSFIRNQQRLRKGLYLYNLYTLFHVFCSSSVVYIFVDKSKCSLNVVKDVIIILLKRLIIKMYQ